MLYEALTGRLPFEGPALLAALSGRLTRAGAAAHARAAHARRSRRAGGARCSHRDPERRPRAGEVVARLAGASPPARAAPSEPDPHAVPSPFVGRHAELAELELALHASRGALCTVEIHGASGIGKSALLERVRRARATARPRRWCCARAATRRRRSRSRRSTA